MKEIKNEVSSFDEEFDSLLYYDKKALDESIAIENNNERLVIGLKSDGVDDKIIMKNFGYTEKEIERIWDRHLLEEAMEKDEETLHKLIRELIAKNPGISYRSFVEFTTHLNPQEIEAILKEDTKD